MAKLAGIDVPALINTEIGKVLTDTAYDFIITKVVPGSRGADATAGNAPTETTHGCRGVVSDYAARQIDGTVVQTGDRSILILAKSIVPAVVPAPGDKITAAGKTYRIIRAERDPVVATYTVQVRGA